MRAVAAVRKGEKAVRKMRRSNNKVNRAKQIGSPGLAESAMRDLEMALKDMRWAIKELDVVIGRINKGLPFPGHVKKEAIECRQALENMAILIMEAQRETPGLRNELIAGAERTRSRDFGAMLEMEHGKIAVIENVTRGIIDVESTLSEAAEVLQPAIEENQRIIQAALQETFQPGGGLGTIKQLHAMESKNDLKKAGEAVNEIGRLLHQLKDMFREDAPIPDEVSFGEIFARTKSALNSLDYAIGDSNLALPRALTMPVSATLSVFGGEIKEGILDKLQKNLEDLEDFLWQLYTAIPHINKHRGKPGRESGAINVTLAGLMLALAITVPLTTHEQKQEDLPEVPVMGEIRSGWENFPLGENVPKLIEALGKAGDEKQVEALGKEGDQQAPQRLRKLPEKNSDANTIKIPKDASILINSAA